MKVAILAGGLGTRLAEETVVIPKPMIEVGGMPLLWHIMKIYSHYGFHEFVILLGYKGYIIKEYFANYFLHQSDVTFDLAQNQIKIHNHHCEPWKVTLVDTGFNTQTGGRILRAKEYLSSSSFFLTYGDGVANIDIMKLFEFHKNHGKIATVTSVQPEGRYGAIVADSDGKISSFTEKPPGDGAWINAGFFIFEPEIFDYFHDGDMTVLEQNPLEKLAESGGIYSYQHYGFWRCMDTLRDKIYLQEIWDEGKAPWVIW